jgi:hypothetical protein
VESRLDKWLGDALCSLVAALAVDAPQPQRVQKLQELQALLGPAGQHTAAAPSGAHGAQAQSWAAITAGAGSGVLLPTVG